MKRAFIGFIICLFILNCGKKESPKHNTPYIISEKDIKPEKLKETKNKHNNIQHPPPPPPPIPGWLTYGTNTFIIDSDSKIYYFQGEKIGFICGTGSQNDTIPHFINLQPKDLIEIPSNSIFDFVKLNYKDDFRNLTFVSSKLDTLKSESFFNLINALESSLKDRDFYYIGRTTQEEDTVLKYKKNNSYYRSDDIKWDKTKIEFPVKFIKPAIKIKSKT
nr:hypothetical protein [uncultured Flavobacterium sp.]